MSETASGRPLLSIVIPVYQEGASLARVLDHLEHALAGLPISLHEAGHPVPDERGVRATRAAVNMLSGVRREDAVVCLISGGASALLTDPLLPLKDWRKLIELLLKSGCSINELNTVRRAVDRIKSGGLARAASPASTYGLILSDVVGNPITPYFSTTSSSPTRIEYAILY